MRTSAHHDTHTEICFTGPRDILDVASMHRFFRYRPYYCVNMVCDRAVEILNLP